TPFRGSGTMAVLKRVIEDAPRPPRQINLDVPDWLEAIVLKLLSKSPDDRFYTAEAGATLLEKHLAHEREPTRFPLPAPVAGPRPPKRPPTRVPRWRIAIIAGLFAIGLFVFLRGMYPYLRPTGVLLIETDIPDLEVSTGEELVKLDSID